MLKGSFIVKNSLPFEFGEWESDGEDEQRKRVFILRTSEGEILHGGCNFFSWVDPPICDRSKNIMPKLLRKINALERANEDFKFENSKLEGKVEKLQKNVENFQALNKKLVSLDLIESTIDDELNY
ncbi:acyl transferase [Striga asiatica]|uniref:Acyl transferase n=1 Tax=Striga asiatica TaxID=4170 RepID=A0A5A7P6S7_STRAF|nr:acyl transferase [Striga asiatica]